MRKFVVNTDGGGEYVCQLSDASAREIARDGCKVGPLNETVTPHHNPVMEQATKETK